MQRMLALTSFLFALYGCDFGGHTIVQRSSENGRDTLHSRIRIADGSAHFDCLASASGRCHYTVFAEDCATSGDSGAACRDRPLRRFEVAVGQTRDIAGLTAFTPCVGSAATEFAADCTPARAAPAQ